MAQDLDALNEKRVKLQEQLAEVDAKIEELKKARRDELLAELKTLGFDQPKRTRKAQQQKSTDDKFCKICDLKGHDTRSHRRQGKREDWKKFTKKELDELAGTEA